jgi:hypothetical protein
MLPALPIVTALPPPMLYNTLSPMTLPEEETLIGSAENASVLLRQQASPIVKALNVMMRSVY